MKKCIFPILVIIAALFGLPREIFAQGTAFTYQGRLNDGANPASGTYDLEFALYDALSGGVQQGVSVTNAAVGVTNGLFTVTLDFGSQFPGAARWLEIAVRTNGAAAFTKLGPRQNLTPTPYAIFATTANNLTAASNQPVSLSVNGTNVLRITLANDFYGITANSVGGSPANVISNGIVGGFIGGGGASPSYPNRVGGNYASVLGGLNNTASGYASTAMGESSTASGAAAIAMGERTVASGVVSAAMGNRANANDQGTFVWADSQASDFVSSGVNQFLIRASGGVGINTNNPAATLDVNGTFRVGAGTTIFKNLQGGIAQMASGSSTVKTNFTFTFPKAFTTVPNVVVSARSGNIVPVDDTFAVSVRDVTANTCTVNIVRVDNPSGWSQQVKINWIAWE